MRYLDPRSPHRNTGPNVFYGDMVWVGPAQRDFVSEEAYLDAVSDLNPSHFHASGTYFAFSRELSWGDADDFTIVCSFHRHRVVLRYPYHPPPGGRDEADLGAIPWVMV